MDREWKQAAEIIEQIESDGHEAYFVGGSVRDIVLKRAVKDFDIATSALPNEIEKLFPKTFPVGIQHGTVLVRHKHQSYEVTTFRDDGAYSDRRHPDAVRFLRDIKQDLARRDFTMNALAMDKTGKLIDPFEGRADIEEKRIRTVGSAKERFTEDALRILRALRFSSQLGFTIEQETLIQMTRLREEVKHVAIERIREECTKFFQGAYLEHGMAYLRETKLAAVLPIFSHHPQLIDITPSHLTAFTSFAEVIALYHYKARHITISEWISAWKCSNQQKQIATQFAESLFRYEQFGLDRWLVYRLPEELISGFVHVQGLLFPSSPITMEQIGALKKTVPINSKKEMAINGEDIKGMFPTRRRGAWIGRLLHQVEYAIVNGTLANDKLKIKEWILCHPPDKN